MLYNATNISRVEGILPIFVVFHSYNSFFFQAENPGAGFVCYASHRHKVSNGFWKGPVSRPAWCHIQWIRKYNGSRRSDVKKHKTLECNSDLSNILIRTIKGIHIWIKTRNNCIVRQMFCIGTNHHFLYIKWKYLMHGNMCKRVDMLSKQGKFRCSGH